MPSSSSSIAGDACSRRRSAWALASVSGPGEVEQVRAFGVVELQCCRDGFEHGLGDTAEPTPFHPVVVVHADACKGRHFFAAQALDAPRSKAGSPASLGVSRARREVGSRALRAVVHGIDDTTLCPHEGCTGSTRNHRDCRGRPLPGCIGPAAIPAMPSRPR